MAADDQDVPGLDLVALTHWWERTLEQPLAGPLRPTLLAGGKSNLTYRVSDGASSWVVRRPPLGRVLATAHDMAREFRVISALSDTAVPVPRGLALCSDTTVLGAPFYVMSDVAGTPYRTAAQLTEVGPDRTRRICESMLDTLAALHAVDPDEVGLSDLGRPAGFLQRQVRRWNQQLDASRTRPLPGADELYRRLAAAAEDADAAAAAAVGIVHGDYRLENILVAFDPARGDHTAAVIDWELATLGDTLTDVALLLVYDRMPQVAPGISADAALAPGFLSESEALQHYTAARGTGPLDLSFHIALASFKLLAIMEGLHHRFLHHDTVGPGFDRIGEAAAPLAEAGLASLDHFA